MDPKQSSEFQDPSARNCLHIVLWNSIKSHLNMDPKQSSEFQDPSARNCLHIVLWNSIKNHLNMDHKQSSEFQDPISCNSLHIMLTRFFYYYKKLSLKRDITRSRLYKIRSKVKQVI